MTQMQQPAQRRQPSSTSGRIEEPTRDDARLTQDRSRPDQSLVVWSDYWRNQGQPWRTEPEIDRARQEQLASCRAIVADPGQGLYPFRGMRLTRADIEWLLATHHDGKGPVNWQDESERRREGLDLRGAILEGEESQGIDLRGLPLARLCGGLARSDWNGWARASQDVLQQAAIHMENADLFGAHLEGACLTAAQLGGADLRVVGLEGANLSGARLDKANLTGARLDGANLAGAHLEHAYLTGAQLLKANMHGAQLGQAMLFGAQLNEAYLVGAHLEEANFTGAQLEGANLRKARLGRTILCGAQLDRVDFTEVVLADEHGLGPRLDAVHWGNADLSTIDWLPVRQLDDEYIASQSHQPGEQSQYGASQAYRKAARASRQLASILRSQSLTEEAAYFNYRAHVLRRKELLHQLRGMQGRSAAGRLSGLSRYLFSGFISLTTGYGYKPWRSIFTYLLLIVVFSLAYAVFGHIPIFPEALVQSLLNLHGRSFFSQGSVSAAIVLAAVEATIGLGIEILYIIVYTRRFIEM